MRRDNDFEQRRQHIAHLTDQELYDRFWELTAQVVDPLLEQGRKHTTPCVERAVLLRLAEGEYWDDAVALFKGGK